MATLFDAVWQVAGVLRSCNMCFAYAIRGGPSLWSILLLKHSLFQRIILASFSRCDEGSYG